jgi:hypothetical protein
MLVGVRVNYCDFDHLLIYGFVVFIYDPGPIFFIFAVSVSTYIGFRCALNTNAI